MSVFDGKFDDDDVKYLVEYFVNFVCLTKEQLNYIDNKIKNKKDLNFSDIILLKKIELLSYIINNKGEKI